MLGRKGREEHGLFLAEGPNVVADLLGSEVPVQRVLVAPPARGDEGRGELVRRAEAAGIRVEEVGEAELVELSDTVTPQGVLAVARIPERGWPGPGPWRILVLDAVQDPGNVGTLIRTAEAVGAAAVACLQGTADPWSPKAVRAAAGSSFRIPVLSVRWEEARRQIRSAGAAIWAADPGGEPFFRGDVAPAGLALVLGNEARGVSAGVLEAADRRVCVPMAGRAESLNVAAAGAILMDRVIGAHGLEGLQEGGDVGGG